MSETEEVTPPVSEAEAVRRREMLISVAELEARLKYALSPDEKDTAAAVIWDASNLARLHGRPSWMADAVPPVVKTIVRNACVRYMDLSESVVQSRAGDETEAYTDLALRTGTVFYTPDEVRTLRQAAGLDSTLSVVHTFVHSPVAPTSRDVDHGWRRCDWWLPGARFKWSEGDL